MISASLIADVRSRHDLVAFAEGQGIALRKAGGDFLGLCPFHADRSPSLSISAKKQMWCCLGACSAGGKKLGGDVIELARRLWSCSFPEAVRRLGSGVAPNNGTEIAAPPPLRLVPPAPNRRPRTGGPSRTDLLGQVVAFYHQTLLESRSAREYLASRGIAAGELVSSLALGFADGSLLERAPEGSETFEGLVGLGVLSASGAEHFAGCVTFPLHDLAGGVVGLYGRGVESDRHVYLPGPRRGLVNAQAAATCDELIVAESVIDALSFLAAGIPNAVPIYGTNGWTPDHDELIEKHRVRRVVLALDTDDAGRKASAALGEKLASRGLAVRAVELPAGDPNELLVKQGPAGFKAVWQGLTAAPAAKKEKRSEAEATAARELVCDAGVYSLSFGSRAYRVRGLAALGIERLRVNLRVEQGARFHIDTFDLYAHLSRRRFVDAAIVALGLPEKTAGAELADELAAVIEALERQRLALQALGKSEAQPEPMSAPDREAALAFLKAPDLVQRLKADFAAVGCVGEETALLVGYLSALSRKLAEPLSILFCARSGAGKSNLQERITELVPPEDLLSYTRVTTNALFYKDVDALKNKVLAIDEEQGAAEAAYSLRNLMSGGYLSVSATRTDPQTGKQATEDYRVNGPTSVFLTTTNPEALDFETRNRFVLLTVDESKEQTRKILERQRWAETLDGLMSRKKRDVILKRHHNAQRLLASVEVVNNLAPDLRYPADRLLFRREQKKYLALIRAVALIHQHQRPRRRVEIEGTVIEYVEVERSDIELVAELGRGILRRNLDELAPPTRSLLAEIARLAAEKAAVGEVEPSVDRYELQKATGLSYHHIRAYLDQLEALGYIARVRGGRGRRSLYELLWSEAEDDLPPEAIH